MFIPAKIAPWCELASKKSSHVNHVSTTSYILVKCCAPDPLHKVIYLSYFSSTFKVHLLYKLGLVMLSMNLCAYQCYPHRGSHSVYPKKYAHGFVVLCFVVIMQSFIMNWHEVFIPIHQSCFASTWAIVRLPQCQWGKPVGYEKISQCITTTKHSKAKTVCLFLGIYCISQYLEDSVMYHIIDHVPLAMHLLAVPLSYTETA